MNQRLLITLGILVFLLLGTYIAIHYAEGYRLNLSKKTVEGTGLLVANSLPRGASIYIDNELKSATDDTLHLTPGSYKIKLEKDRYKTWEKELKIPSELVTQTNARLFPAVPSFSALTFNGASNLAPSPDGHMIAFQIATGSAQTKYGIWVLNLNDTPLRFGSNTTLIAADTPAVQFSKAQLFWSPNSNELLAYFNENQVYILKANSENKTQNLVNAAFQVPALLEDWQQQLAQERSKRLAKLPKEMQQIATTSATLLYFSPNEEKLMYTATASATIPDKLIPAPPSINNQPQERTLVAGSMYVYDTKEDTNFMVIKNAFDQTTLQQYIKDYYVTELEKPTTSPLVILPAITPVKQPKTMIEQLISIQAQYSPIYSHKRLQWFPDSYHLIEIDSNSISIVEYDSNNKTEMFSGKFLENFVYPWPNGNKLIILTSLTTDPDIPANLYALDLE